MPCPTVCQAPLAFDIYASQRSRIERLQNEILDLSELVTRYIRAYQQARVDFITMRREVSSAEKRVETLRRQIQAFREIL